MLTKRTLERLGLAGIVEDRTRAMGKNQVNIASVAASYS